MRVDEPDTGRADVVIPGHELKARTGRPVKYENRYSVGINPFKPAEVTAVTQHHHSGAFRGAIRSDEL